MQQLFLIDTRSIATVLSHRRQLGQLFLIDTSVWDNLRNPLTPKYRNNYEYTTIPSLTGIVTSATLTSIAIIIPHRHERLGHFEQ
jgi:hypothetical protein